MSKEQMNEITIFTKGLWRVRAGVDESGAPWFIAADVCNVLGLGNTAEALRRLDDDEKGVISTDTPGGRQCMTTVAEAGLYNLVMGSRKAEAREFKRWVTHEVLPTIRKYGVYATPATVDAMLADPDTMIRTLQALKEERTARLVAQAQLAIAEPKVAGFDKLMSSDDCVSLGEAAKALGTGQNRLFRFLRGQKVLMSDNLPYQEHINAHRFRVIEQPWTDRDGVVHVNSKTLVTPRGIDYVRRLLEKERMS